MIKASIDDYITKLKSKREYEGGDDEGSEVIEKKRQKREIILGHLRNATNEIDRSIKVVENLKSRGGGVGKKKNLFYLELSEHVLLFLRIEKFDVFCRLNCNPQYPLSPPKITSSPLSLSQM